MSSFGSLSNKDCPCKGCLDRFVGCHSSCVRYIDWDQKHKVKLANIREQKSMNSLLFNNQTYRNKQIKQQGGIKYGRHRDDSR